MKASLLKVPGASLYYEVRGSGPVFLMMPGGPADAGAFRRIAGAHGGFESHAPEFAVRLREVLAS